MSLSQSSQKSTFATKNGAEISFDVATATLQSCYLFRLPNELLAELAAWLSHPVDLLSLALTSKYHYERLTGPQASLLWRRTRAVFEPEPVPDPPEGLTEIAWAQFLFGLNYCGGCGRKTYDLPFSFALRLHVCKPCAAPEKVKETGLFSSLQHLVEETRAFLRSRNASINGSDNLLLLTFVYRATPRLEARRSRAYCEFQMLWELAVGPSGDYLISRESVEHSTNAWRSAVEALGQTQDPGVALIENCREFAFRKRHGVDSEQGSLIFGKRLHSGSNASTQAAEKLLGWSMRLQDTLDVTESGIVYGAKVWAKEQSIEYDDLTRSRAFRELWTLTKRRRLASMVPLLTEHHDELIPQTRRIHSSRMQSAQALALSKRQQAMEKYYQSKIATQEYCPSFRVFKSLPVVKSIIQNTALDNIRRDLKTEAIRNLISADVKAWVDLSTRAVRLLLQDKVNTPREGKQTPALLWDEHSEPDTLAPEKRCTSLFICGVCEDVEGPYKRAGVLDFKGLCRHECKEKNKSRKERTRWAIANFKLAPKAQEVVGRMLELENLRAEDTPSNFLFDSAQENERRWSCGNCALVPMSRPDLVRHCQRHDEQKISLLSQGETSTAPQKRPFSFAELASGKRWDEARRKQFECAHCDRTGTQETERAVLDFNGLRCHLKSKHAILDVRNEDFGIVQT